MVNVAGRSKGCHTCRKRKIALPEQCDLQKPVCAKCIKSKRVCLGYERNLVFIADPQSSTARPTPTTTAVEDDASPTWATTSPYGRSARSPSQGSSVRPAALKRRSQGSQMAKAVLSLPVSSAPACRRQLFAAYLEVHVPFDHIQPQEDSWMPLLWQYEGWPLCLEYAVLSVCLAKLGRASNDASFTHEAMTCYANGLRGLRVALLNSDMAKRDEVLAACMLLATYETMECPEDSRSAYICHLQGCGRLIQFRGPRAHTSALAHQLFRMYRAQAILEALRPPHTSFLLEPDWMNVPWQKSRKSSLDRILDLLSSGPVIFQQVRQFQHLQERPKELVSVALDILDQCLRLHKELERFYERLAKSHKSRGQLYWPRFSQSQFVSVSAPAVDNLNVFPVCYEFPDLTTANILMFYWATLTMLNSGISSLHKLLSSLTGETGFQKPFLRTHRLPRRNSDVPLSSGDEDYGTKLSPSHGQSSKSTPEPEPEPVPNMKSSLDLDTDTGTDMDIDPIAPARNVFQSVEYCLHEQMLGLGPAVAVAPIMIVLETLHDRSDFQRERQWAQAVLDYVASRGARIVTTKD
ncbi:hypothetical protein A1O3_01504 [Capronia epimyces CBS 606.96]|uniref:Zn(2)-C6 fungal-type domain-containing protein n=1 Tax=Capronia epimyces CBS 606.96 TaxID=1182542 RepID=W9YK86_9EURO|nr:uncharacterized protein A1O3_01504 [Capronia epimyces CBS 606.96]EXJ92948.1 hypothetical protein A1O3_01504 [Capronia epimyces CBS 606.96]